MYMRQQTSGNIKIKILKFATGKDLINMEQKTLARWLKIIIIGTGLCGIVVGAFLLPKIPICIRSDNGVLFSPIFSSYSTRESPRALTTR